MDKNQLIDGIWAVSKHSAQQYNDYDKYTISDKRGNIIANIANDGNVAEKIVSMHNDLIYNLLRIV